MPRGGGAGPPRQENRMKPDRRLSHLLFVLATGLLLTDPMAAAIRVTKDVDVIVEVASHGG